ncbi:polysaccharide pyruvyl transferase CsaB [Paenibacillus crassostreae]|uniref:Polysaccharide pyruvyl transferase n=1 Tax=Paenibacillus crassostreae TaxID=1763538 RepID=A0A167D7T3_9BACL|nr:polysaccharide pyruvyl transferase CsaB [Paenibacillus crassostreae]AOZ93218.1 polysaccharide pyruvyl transferase CsaB [Paenibacillus crassostreae]OAB74041.1 polysaccharide pyruvyl transferase [Paenibacillus crassostreae]
MVTTPHKIVISGYYGYKNSGDEAVLQSILTALQEQATEAGIQIQPVVLSIDPERTSATYGIEAVHRMKLGEVRQAIKSSCGLISGGGSLLQDATGMKTIPYYLGIIKLAQWMGKPTFIYSQGVGPVNHGLFYPMIKSVFKKCAYISVRDQQSGELLQKMGLNANVIDVVPDPVMGLQLRNNEISNEVINYDPISLPVIGISVRYWEQDRKELVKIVEGLQQVMSHQPLHLRFLPFHLPSDVEASQFMIDLLGDTRSTGSRVSLCADVDHPQDMLREISECQIVIAMRLHSLIYAANSQVPMIGISYDPKIDHFLNRLDLSAVGNTATLNAGDISSELERILFHEEDWRKVHATQIIQLKQEAKTPARAIVEYIANKVMKHG